MILGELSVEALSTHRTSIFLKLCFEALLRNGFKALRKEFFAVVYGYYYAYFGRHGFS